MFSDRYKIKFLVGVLPFLLLGCSKTDFGMEEVFSNTEINVQGEADFWSSDTSIHAYVWCNYAIGQTLNEAGILYIEGVDSAMEYGKVRSSTVSLNIRFSDIGLDANNDGYTDYSGIVHELYGENRFIFGDSLTVKCSKDTVYSIRPFLILNWANIIYGGTVKLNE